MARTHIMTSSSQSDTMSRGDLLHQAGLGVAALTAGTVLPGLLNAGTAHAAVSFSQGTLNVMYWYVPAAQEQRLRSVFDGFGQQHGLRVKYSSEPQSYPDFVTKITSYLSSGYSGLDAIWQDDFTTPAFARAGWLEPLEHVIPRESVAAIAPEVIKGSTYNGHLYRVPGYAGAVLFFYRKDLLDKEGLHAPRTWQELVQAGKRLTKGGRYGIGIAGKNGTTELFNEIAYYMGQAGGHPLHLKTKAARTALKFIFDMVHTYKIAPPDTPTADYTTLTTSFQQGRIAMWPVWGGILSQFLPNAKPQSKIAGGGTVAVALPPRGPVNNTTIADSWGWTISKFSKNKALAAKFIAYATSPRAEATLALNGVAPARVAVLSDPKVQQAVPVARYLAVYDKLHLPHPRPLTPQTQRLSDAIEASVNKYLNHQIGLDAAINEAQQKIDQIQRLG
jgi:multiple sugar transport system substrate-binding protein